MVHLGHGKKCGKGQFSEHLQETQFKLSQILAASSSYDSTARDGSTPDSLVPIKIAVAGHCTRKPMVHFGVWGKIRVNWVMVQPQEKLFIISKFC